VTHDFGQMRRLADATLVVVGGRIASGAEAQSFLAEESHGE
jgi:ABC-type thiamine transport system ATPase subunit